MVLNSIDEDEFGRIQNLLDSARYKLNDGRDGVRLLRLQLNCLHNNCVNFKASHVALSQHALSFLIDCGVVLLFTVPGLSFFCVPGRNAGLFQQPDADGWHGGARG